MTTQKKYVLQLCHGYAIPFLDVARQYASLFDGTGYHVITVYLVGISNEDVIKQTASDQVIFLENKSNDLRGLKRKQIKQLRQICAQYDFEFSIGHRYKSIYILSHIKNLDVIGVHHAFDVYSRFMRRFFVMNHSENLCLLGVSDAIRDDIKKHLPKFPQQQIQTLYNRINVEQVQSEQIDKFKAREYLGLAQNSYVFANVGRLHPDKDQKTLINAFAKVAPKLANSVLVILGKGKLEQQLKQQVEQLQLTDRVVFLGVVPQAANYFRAFDSFVLSSDYEPFGMVLLEAIIAELPIIATGAGGAKEIIPNKNWLFNIGDTDKLAELMLEVYALDDAPRQTINKQNMVHLQQNFTDHGVRQSFWQLPFIQKHKDV